ncbi:hypothetical protein [Antrihabitans sp. YC2-6]|uniref:SCO6745 family protein n=1 Tax=Antrihabitans sp. YC2-6 TaxID=2799498 RepID=UPI0018F6B60A|nr:hypothetical protein [Antrihabitans sp. YC2-6]MBJ8345886.1 hypothetical protein [Antrihabitans sp. YC2-6]
MDATAVGRYAKPLDALHAVSYFAPEVTDSLVDAGLEKSGMCYFASRSAAMGRVAPSVVAATFYNFNPELIRGFIPRAWDLATPERIIEARYRGVDAVLRRVLGDKIESPDLAEAADLAAIAARAAQPEGRPLFAAHADLPWPDEPHLQLWHAMTLLREHRGDGHIIALNVVGLSGIEALMTHISTGKGFTAKFGRTRRGWSQEQWDDAAAGLRDREILDESGDLTELGTEIRAAAEDLTDDLGLAPWEALGESGFDRLLEIAEQLHTAVIDSGVFPRDAFGQTWAAGTWPS